MPTILITSLDGKETMANGEAGHSVMEVIRDAGFDDLLAICGGCCSCATCHVYVDTSFAAQLPPMSEDENTLLDGSAHRRSESRLSCQIPFVENLDGMKVVIVAEN